MKNRRTEPGTVAQVCNSSMWDAEGRDSRVQGSLLHSEMEASLGYTRSNHKIQTQTRMEGREGGRTSQENVIFFPLLGYMIARVQWLLSVCSPVLRIEKERWKMEWVWLYIPVIPALGNQRQMAWGYRSPSVAQSVQDQTQTKQTEEGLFSSDIQL